MRVWSEEIAFLSSCYQFRCFPCCKICLKSFPCLLSISSSSFSLLPGSHQVTSHCQTQRHFFVFPASWFLAAFVTDELSNLKHWLMLTPPHRLPLPIPFPSVLLLKVEEPQGHPSALFFISSLALGNPSSPEALNTISRLTIQTNISSPDPSPEFWTQLSNYLLAISNCMSNRHFKLNLFCTELWFFFLPLFLPLSSPSQ